MHDVACCAVLIALVTAFVSPSNPCFHPGFDIDHSLPEGFMDHPFDCRIAAQGQINPFPELHARIV